MTFRLWRCFGFGFWGLERPPPHVGKSSQIIRIFFMSAYLSQLLPGIFGRSRLDVSPAPPMIFTWKFLNKTAIDLLIKVWFHSLESSWTKDNWYSNITSPPIVIAFLSPPPGLRIYFMKIRQFDSKRGDFLVTNNLIVVCFSRGKVSRDFHQSHFSGANFI